MKRFLKTAFLAAVSTYCISVETSFAADTVAMARAFGARPAIDQISLSPDGMRVAMVQPAGARGSAVYVVDLAQQGQLQPKQILMTDGKPQRISSCQWASNTRLLCRVYGITKLEFGDITYASRMVALDYDGRNRAVLNDAKGSGLTEGYNLYGGSVIDWTGSGDGHVLMARNYVPESSTGTRAAQTKSGFGVDDIDTQTLKARSVEPPRNEGIEYISDGYGSIRIMGMRMVEGATGYDSGKIRYLYRQKSSKEWNPLAIVDDDSDVFNPYGVDSTLDVAYGLKKVDGRMAAFSKALDGTGTEKLIYSRPDVDVDGFIRIGRHGRIVGVSYVTDRGEAVYFDPALAKLSKSLAKALPNLPLIRFVDSSQDETRLMIWVGSDVDPGHYYLFDKAGGKLEEISAERPDLESVKLATVKAVSYPAADGTMIPGYLTMPASGTGKGIPALVMPHGGPGARDQWGFDWLSQYFASLGYAVLQPNFRGSTGYGDAWFQKNGFQNWRTAIGDVDDAGRWLVAQAIADPAKLAIFGWSYGGYAALQSAVTEPGLFKAVVAVAPVTDLDRLREERSHWSDYKVASRFIGTGPHIEAGSPARHAEQIKVPVLMFHGTMDRNVDVAESQLMDTRLKRVGANSTLILYDGLDHYLEDDEARTEMLSKSAAFLEQAFAHK